MLFVFKIQGANYKQTFYKTIKNCKFYQFWTSIKISTLTSKSVQIHFCPIWRWGKFAILPSFRGKNLDFLWKSDFQNGSLYKGGALYTWQQYYINLGHWVRNNSLKLMTSNEASLSESNFLLIQYWRDSIFVFLANNNFPQAIEFLHH